MSKKENEVMENEVMEKEVMEMEKEVVEEKKDKKYLEEIKFKEMVEELVESGDVSDKGKNVLIEWFGMRWKKSDKRGRKDEVLEILEESKEGISLKEIGEKLKISSENASSVVMYLRKDGIEIVSVDKKKILKKYLGNLFK